MTKRADDAREGRPRRRHAGWAVAHEIVNHIAAGDASIRGKPLNHVDGRPCAVSASLSPVSVWYDASNRSGSCSAGSIARFTCTMRTLRDDN